MFRKEFISVVTNTGMLTLKELRAYTTDREEERITELELLRIDGFDDVRLAKQAAEQYQIQFINLENARLSDALMTSFKKSIMTRFRVVPVQQTEGGLVLATFDPTIKSIMNEVRQAVRRPVDIILTTMRAWKNLFDSVNESIDELVSTIKEVVPDAAGNTQEAIKEEDIGDEVINYVNQILAEAFIRKASDIHIEPYEKMFRVRLRIDGKLFKLKTPPQALMLPMISRIKIMSQMDISEKRKPQDGRIKLMIGGRPIDYRVSSLPTLFGEKVVLRLLDNSNLELDLTKLGMDTKQIDVFKKGIYRPYGMCLVTGPTGSGKTTTLYSALSDLNKITTNISTAEDPVEFNLEGINQVNIRREAGLTFAVALKSFLRQDPDIIMVGEIRDHEVGEIAVEAALTGHLVLSTLHTNDAPSTITRLIQMGLEPFLLVAALNVVVAQRLCRRICESCKTTDKNVSIEQLIAAGISASSAAKVTPKKGAGCNRCNQTGYKGRVAIYEVLEMTPELRDMVLKGGTSDALKNLAMKQGMRTLRMSALMKVAQGVTTFEEAVSNSSSDRN